MILIALMPRAVEANVAAAEHDPSLGDLIAGADLNASNLPLTVVDTDTGQTIGELSQGSMEFGCTEVVGPQLTQIVSGLGPDAATFISPLGENVPFTNFEIEVTEPAVLNDHSVVFTGNPANTPRVAALNPIGGLRYTVVLDRPIEPGQWAKITLEVESTLGCPGSLVMWVAHQPLDTNQSAGTNIADATTFGVQFRGPRELRLININGDSKIAIDDATAFGNNWNGRSPASRPWANTSLPAKPE